MSNNVPFASIGGFQRRTPEENRRLMTNFHVQRNTVLVRFRYATVTTDAKGVKHTSGRTGTVLLNPDEVLRNTFRRMQWARDEIKNIMQNEFNRIGVNWSGGTEDEQILFVDEHGEFDITVDEVKAIMGDAEILQALGALDDDGATHSASSNRMYGYLEDNEPQHRAFRYMIEGCDMKTLQHIVPDEWNHNECDKMCAYRMLSDNNNQKSSIRLFRPEVVNKWMNDNGRAVGGLHDGLTSDDIQAHAIQFRYGHCAMDLARSVLNLYIPTDRNHHHKTACYVVVGDHCQPIVDTNVVKSVMHNASSRVGRRQNTGYGHVPLMLGGGNNGSGGSTTNTAEAQGMRQTQDRRKRRRSLDRVFKPEFEKSEERIASDQWKDNNNDTIDITLDDWEDDFNEAGGQTDNIPSYTATQKKIKLPLVSENNRFHFFTKEHDLRMVEERCKPTFREGDDHTLIHYYICTDDDNVEFLYNYLLRVLKIDPLRYARSFNGQCRTIRMQNVWWYASRDIHTLMQLHGVLHPQEPFRVSGMATYAFRMLHRELYQLTRKAGALWECLSHYPPNLQRLLDSTHPYNRPKIIQATFNPPYTNPKDSPDKVTVHTLIPMSQRRRVDLIRSYASTILNLKDDEYPIHDPTNLVVPYNEDLHGEIPIGHYLVDIPTTTNKTTEDEWKRLPCLPPGLPKMMSHRMLRALLDRQLLTKKDIRLVCQTDSVRQKKYGLALVQGLKNVLQTIYKSADLQTISPKHLINHLIGLCNGTSMPHSGMRYVFHDLHHLYTLLVTTVAEDQLRRIKVSHVVGHDPLWKKSFDYYEIDSSGLQYRSFHLQPVFNMVLEDQAIRIFDIARTIPLASLIQINVDAIEYRVEDLQSNAKWVLDIQKETVTKEDYADLTPSQLYDDGYMGRYKTEDPKDENKAMMYYYRFNTPNAQATLNRYFNGTLDNQGIQTSTLNDTENQEYIPSWKEALYKSEPTEGQTDEFMNNHLTQMFLADENNKTGMIVTGPAGTGKTHWIRLLQKFAVNLGHTVIKTAYTHAACVQMGCDAVTLNSLFGLDEKTDLRCTMSMSRRFQSQIRALDVDLLIIDEISMIPFDILEVLLLFHRTSPKTRICLFGDFHQLAPVEPHWDRPDEYNYFDMTDIFPYLVYDRVRNKAGQWIKLTECMRTTDPLLVKICKDPLCAPNITPSDFPMPSGGIPIWRFITWRNSTRKAANFYCMHRYLQMYPDRHRHRFLLRDLYAANKYAEYKRRPANPAIKNDAPVDMDHFRNAYGTGYRPRHWIYLQNFTYAVGMAVVCRNTLKQWNEDKEDGKRPQCVNNRRGVITTLDTIKKNVTIRWYDVIRRREELGLENNDTDELEEDVTLTFHDFAFNFVPGFCITSHMAQGETIREHYGVLEWQDISTMPKMAYVAVTRGSTSEFLHIVPQYSDPWNHSDTNVVSDNVLRKMYHNYRWDKNQTYELDVQGVMSIIQKQQQEEGGINICTQCRIPLVMARYPYKANNQFMLTTLSKSMLSRSSLSPTDCTLVCDSCYSAAIYSFKKTAPPASV